MAKPLRHRKGAIGGIGGQFRKPTIILDSAVGRTAVLSKGGLAITQVTGQQEVAARIEAYNRQIASHIQGTANEKASAIESRLREAVIAEYTRAATGRFARGLHVRVSTTGSPGGKVSSSLKVTSINYRESQFLTNMGGGGHWAEFPVEPYRIFAKGVEDRAWFFSTARRNNSIRSAKRAIKLVKGEAGETGRLKVPKSTSFFTASRKPGRGGGESRQINDALGPPDPGDLLSSFFFYPLWVNHPGFRRDVVTEVLAVEAERFQRDMLTAANQVPSNGGSSVRMRTRK